MPGPGDINGGFRESNSFNIEQFLSGISVIDTTDIKNLTTQIRELVVALNRNKGPAPSGTGSYGGYGGGRDFLSPRAMLDIPKNFGTTARDLIDSIESFRLNLDKTLADANSEIRDLQASMVEDHRMSAIERIQKRKQLELLQQNEAKQASIVAKYQEQLDELKNQLSEQALIQEQYNNLLEGTTKHLKELENSGTATQEEIEAAQNAIAYMVKQLQQSTLETEQINRSYNETQREIRDKIEKANQELYDSTYVTAKQFRNATESIGFFDRAVSGASGTLKSVADFEERLDKNDYEKAQDAIDTLRAFSNQKVSETEKVLNSIKEEVDALTAKIDEDSTLTQEQKEQLEQERKLKKLEQKKLEAELKIAKKQQEYYKRLTPITDIWKNAGQQIGKVPGNIFKSALGNIANYFTKRFVDDFNSGFDKVYNSIESTRNEISARLRLNQGDFSDMQSQIQAEIEAQGLEGSVSQSDVNDALVALATAGITDKEMLKTFALESAKLKAQGIDLDITNEETLERFQNMLKQGSTVDELKVLVETSAAQMQAVKDTLGSGTAFIGGGGNTIVNQVLDMGTAFGKTAEQISEDIGSALYASQATKLSGMDPQLLLEEVNKIVEGKDSELSSFGKMLITQYGLRAENLRDKSYDEILSTISDAYSNVYSNYDANLVPYVQDVWGTTAKVTDIMRMQQTEGSNINAKLPDDFSDTVASTLEKNQQGLQNNTWISETKAVETERENAMTELAIEAEKLYKGDQLYQSVTEPIVTAIHEIENILVGGITGTGGMLLKKFAAGRKATALGGGAASDVAGDIAGDVTGGATGGQSILQSLSPNGTGTLHTIGRIGGAAVGGAMVIDSIRDADSVRDVFTDPEFYSGLAGGVASAFGGPIAGAIVGGLAGLGAKYGNWLGDKAEASDPLLDAFNKTYSDLDEAAKALMESATEQMNATQENLRSYQTMTAEDKKMLLLQQGQLDLDEALSMDEAAVNKKFEETILQMQENELKKQQAEIQRANMLSKTKYSLSNLETNITDLDSLSNEAGSGSGGLSQQSYRVAQLLGGMEQSGTMATTIIDLMAAQGITEYKDAVDKAFEGTSISEEAKTAIIKMTEEIDDNKKKYEENNKIFRDKWDQAKKEAKSNNTSDIALQYAKMFGVDGDTQKWVVPNLKTSGGEGLQMDMSQQIVLDADGYPMLYDAKGTYDPKAYDGKFKTGLTRVPHDNYLALLHEGERVLTKEEASIYNTLSSNAVEQLADSSISNSYLSNVSGDTSIVEKVLGSGFGTDSTLSKSIDKQTSSLENKLDDILKVLDTLVRMMLSNPRPNNDHTDLLRMNSNISQIMTST